MRELVAMAEARGRERWNHTAAILTLLANIHRDPKKSRPLGLADFHPHLERRGPAPPRVGVQALKSVFVDRHGGM